MLLTKDNKIKQTFENAWRKKRGVRHCCRRHIYSRVSPGALYLLLYSVIGKTAYFCVDCLWWLAYVMKIGSAQRGLILHWRGRKFAASCYLARTRVLPMAESTIL